MWLAALVLINAGTIVPLRIYMIWQTLAQGVPFRSWTLTSLCSTAGLAIAGIATCFALARLRNDRFNPLTPILVGLIALFVLMLPQAVLALVTVL